jgi:RHS repeat-associated protein
MTRMTTTKQYDYLNRLISISSALGSSAIGDSYACNSANQRIRSTLADGSYWLYTYDALGQVVAGNKYWSDGTPVAGQQFDYTFDTIGNRTATLAGGDNVGQGLRPASYTANTLNQYTSRGVPGAVDVMGLGFATNAVTVNGQTAYRKGEYFRQQLTVNNASTAVWQSVTNAETGQTSVTGAVFVPKTPENFYYDQDGNLTNDGRWRYSWDAENRLISLTTNAAVGPQQSIKFEYDWKGRRIHKQVWSAPGWTGTLTNDVKFVYDGWNLLAELNSTNNAVIRSFMWGLDLSGSPQGAGGVGGLLEVIYKGAQTTNCFVAFDGNGNVAALVNAADGTTAAQYEYGPFGELLRATGPMARANPFRFSTKFQDDETDLLYYGYRYYNASTGRWLSRDPTEEQANMNLYVFIQNDPANRLDRLGLEGFGPWDPGPIVFGPPSPGDPPQGIPKPNSPRWYTKGFDADAYGLVPWSLSFGFTTPWFIGGAVGGAIEVAYDCYDGTAEAFGVGWIGVGVGTPGFSVSVGKGLNFIYNLPTATAYAGPFVAVTGSGTFGVAGIYGTIFTTPTGAVDLLQTGSVGSQTWNFGAGWASGTPSAGVLFQYEHFWDLGSVPFSEEARQKICRCQGAAPGTVPSQEIRAMALTAGSSKKSAFKEKAKQSLPFVLRGARAYQRIDQAAWNENIW